MPYLVGDLVDERSYPGIRYLTYHSRMRFATSKSGVEALVPCSGTAKFQFREDMAQGNFFRTSSWSRFCSQIEKEYVMPKDDADADAHSDSV